MTADRHFGFRPKAARGLLVFVALLITGGCEKPPAAAPPARPAPPVKTTLAIAQDVPVYLDEIGRCVAYEMVAIQPQVSGKITDRHFKDGDAIKIGDPLFTIDPRPYQAALDQAQATYDQWKAAAELAKIEFKRIEPLVNTKAIAQSDYDTRKSAVAIAEAQAQSAAASLQTAKINLEYCSIRSPIEGIAGQRLVDAGNVVMAGANTSLLVIQRLDPIYADFTITENDLPAVQRNLKNGTLKVEVRLPDDPDHPATGDLTFLDTAVIETSGTVKLRATIANPDHRFWPGRFVKVRLILETLKDAVLIPAGAPQVSAQGQFVFVVVNLDSAGIGVAEMRIIKPGQRQGELLVIREGVKAGDRVITLGQFVMPGGKVHVIEDGKPADAAHDKPATPAAAPAAKDVGSKS